MSAHTQRREFAKRAIDDAIRSALASRSRKSRRAFADLLWRVQYRSPLLRPADHAGHVDRDQLRNIMNGLAALVEFRKEWLRPADVWEPNGSTLLQLFSSLAHHLLASYPVPPVLLQSWFGREGDWHAVRYQRCFCAAGRGKSLREIGLPICLTKRMAHEFAHAPEDFPITYALRWAQVRGLGGSDALAHLMAVIDVDPYFHEVEFWNTVIQLFVKTPALNLSCVRPIVAYLHDRKFATEQIIIGEGTEVSLDPPEPDLSVKGRTVASLMRRVEAWRRECEKARPRKRYLHWNHSPFHEFRRESAADQVWTIRELLDSNALAAEGQEMQHCVADYTAACAHRRTTIWSLGLESSEGRQRLVTIEVNPATKQVVQASMKLNDPPDEFSMSLVKEWAAHEGLALEM
jgi:hypothetical protein